MGNRTLELKVILQEHDSIGKLMDIINAGGTIGGIGLNESIDARSRTARQLKAAQAAEQGPGDSPSLPAPPTERKVHNSVKGDMIRGDIARHLSEGPLPIDTLTKKMGIAASSIFYHIGIMIKKSHAKKLGDGTFALTGLGKKFGKPKTKTLEAKPRGKWASGRKAHISTEAAEAIRLNILKELQSGTATGPKLVVKLGLEDNVILWQCVSLRKRGLVRRGVDGYELTEEGENHIIQASSHLSQSPTPHENAAE